jgi:hypothetical protein
MIQRGLFCLQPNAGMFFEFLPNMSATDVMLRGRERFTDYVERLNISIDRHH